MIEKELDTEFYFVGADDDRSFEDIKNNVYPCNNDNGYVSYSNNKEND